MDLSGTTTEDLIHLLDEIQKELAKRERCSGLKFFSNVHDMMLAEKKKIELNLGMVTAIMEIPDSSEIDQEFHDKLLSADFNLSNIFHMNRFSQSCEATHFEKFRDSRGNKKWTSFSQPDYLENVLNILILPYIKSLGINTDTYCPLRITDRINCLAFDPDRGTYIKVEIDRDDQFFR